jgi:protein dithiol oxidoreductase (disulfide-forming)
MDSHPPSGGYTTLQQPLKGLPPVVVFFSFLDQTSYNWATKYRVVQRIRKSLPKGTEVHMYHVSTIERAGFDMGPTLTLVWAVAVDLRVDDKMIIPVFDAILRDRTVTDLEGIREMFWKVANVPQLQFDRRLGKATVRKEAVWMDEVTRQVHQDGVPVVVVKGKHLVDGAILNEVEGLEGEEFGIKVAELVKNVLEIE